MEERKELSKGKDSAAVRHHLIPQKLWSVNSITETRGWPRVSLG